MLSKLFNDVVSKNRTNNTLVLKESEAIFLGVMLLLLVMLCFFNFCCAIDTHCQARRRNRRHLREHGPGPDVSHAVMELDVVRSAQSDDNHGPQSDNSSSSQGNGDGTGSRLQESVFRLHGVFPRDIH